MLMIRHTIVLSALNSSEATATVLKAGQPRDAVWTYQEINLTTRLCPQNFLRRM